MVDHPLYYHNCINSAITWKSGVDTKIVSKRKRKVSGNKTSTLYKGLRENNNMSYYKGGKCVISAKCEV